MALKEVLQPRWWIQLSCLNGACNVWSRILTRLDLKTLTSLAVWHWISKTYIQSFITRAKSPQHFGRHAILEAQQKRVSSAQRHGQPIISQAMDPGTQFQRGPLVSLKFHQFHYLQQSKRPKKKFQWCKMSVRQECAPGNHNGKGRSAAGLPVPKIYPGWRKKSTFPRLPHQQQQNPTQKKKKWPSTTWAAMRKLAKVTDLKRRTVQAVV